MRTTTTRLVAALAAILFLAAACGSSSDKKAADTKAGGATATTSGIDATALMQDVKLVSNGKLTVCSDIPYTPFEFEGDDGKLTGFDVQLVEQMAKDLGVTADFKTTPFSSIIAAVTANQCDMIASAMTITDERAQQIAFTKGYFDADQSLLIKTADKDTYAKLSDLAGKKIGVQSGTTGETYATDNKPEGATIVAFESGDQIFGALTAGTIDAGLQDFPVNAYKALKDTSLAVTETFPTNEQYGLGAAKTNTALVAALDAALAELRSNGTYDAIYTEWFGAKQ